MAGILSYLAPTSPLPEDRISAITSRLDRLDVKSERSLNELEEIKEVLRKIEGNTNPDDNGKSVLRKDSSEKVTVGIRVHIISIGDIDTLGQTFKCDFFLSARWREPQLRKKYQEREEIDWKNEWHPKIVFFNALEPFEKFQKDHDVYFEDEMVYAVEKYRIKGTFRENLELWDFPLDFQELTITLMSDWGSKMVEFEKDVIREDVIRPETFTAGQEWSLRKHVVTNADTTHKTEGSSENNYPRYRIQCHVERKNGYYLWNIAMIIFLIDILSFSAFSVDSSSPSERLTVTLTLLLTAIAFKIVLAQSLPTISYLTLLDKYILSGLVFLSFVAIEGAVVAVIRDPDAQKLFDRICFGIAVCCFLCIHIVSLIIAVKKTNDRKRVLDGCQQKFLYESSLIKQGRETSRRTRLPDTEDSVRSSFILNESSLIKQGRETSRRARPPATDDSVELSFILNESSLIKQGRETSRRARPPVADDSLDLSFILGRREVLQRNLDDLPE